MPQAASVTLSLTCIYLIVGCAPRSQSPPNPQPPFRVVYDANMRPTEIVPDPSLGSNYFRVRLEYEADRRTVTFYNQAGRNLQETRILEDRDSASNSPFVRYNLRTTNYNSGQQVEVREWRSDDTGDILFKETLTFAPGRVAPLIEYFGPRGIPIPHLPAAQKR
jgi:hypothetical protein